MIIPMNASQNRKINRADVDQIKIQLDEAFCKYADHQTTLDPASKAFWNCQNILASIWNCIETINNPAKEN